MTYLLGYKSAVNRRVTFDNALAPFFIGGVANSIAQMILHPVGTVVLRLRMKSYTQEEMKSKKLDL